MHREGHIGIGMVLYAPAAYYLAEAGYLQLFGIGLVAISAWSFLPDMDMVLPLRHRGPTHSIVAANVAGILTAIAFAYMVVGGYLTSSVTQIGPWYVVWIGLAGFGFLMGFTGVVGHIIGDALTPMGVEPWWPRSRRNYSLELVLAADEDANRQLGMAGAVVMTIALVVGELGYL